MQSLDNINSWNHSIEFQNEDWAIENNQNLQTQNSKNMLSNLSQNLITYENSYKKHIKKIKNLPEITQNIMKRRLKRKQTNFSNIQNQHSQSNLIKDQNPKNTQNINKLKQTNRISRQNNNASKLKKMFEIFKQFNTLNDSILPFKVNLNKISQKRILANIIFKDFTQNKQNQLPQNQTHSTQPITLNVQNLQYRKNAIDNDLIFIKNRVYSLNSKNQNKFLKDEKSSSQKFMNNIFPTEGQHYAAKHKRSSSFTRKKRTFSVKKTQNQIHQKTIEQVCDNCTRMDKLQETQAKIGQKRAKKQIERFSDSRLFNRRQVLYELRSREKSLRR